MKEAKEEDFTLQKQCNNLVTIYYAFQACLEIFPHVAIQGRRKVSDVGGSTRKQGTYEVETYLKFSYERLWQGWLFQVLQMSKKSF